ncbi:unnamed protein product [Enterobius vermicularis]|uniref:Fibronectin type-III domain-containing protein n=1 Tax=Enterobius vermicularis TaxID=51028 RepID=A0A0N4VAX7_ENTVE|nr:unnamed protein product [Enterobius vermicularis]
MMNYYRDNRPHKVLPLAKGSVEWNETLEAASLSERISACNVGCQDLDSTNSTCQDRCAATNATDSCLQGCRAITDIFLHLIQDLLNHVTMSVEDETKEEISTLWKLDGAYQMMVSEIASVDMQWGVQGRSAFSHSPFTTTVINDKVFRDDSMLTKVNIQNLYFGEVELRFCAYWRGNIVVSPISNYKLTYEGSVPQPPKIIAQQQISVTSYVVCWSVTNSRTYKVSLAHLDGGEIYGEKTPHTCYLFKDIPTENCCRASIGYADINSSSEAVIKIELNTNTGSTYLVIIVYQK